MLTRSQIFAAVLGLTAGTAVAQPLDDPRIKQADQLFAEGKALLDSNLLEACGKFDQSFKLNPNAVGTVVNVALCDEKLGKVASAAAHFAQVRDDAKEQGLPQHLKLAEEHLAIVEPLVPHLTIKLAEPLPGTQVLVDDKLLADGAMASVAVDPGERSIVVNAPDRLPYRTKIIIKKSEHKDVVVPALAQSIVVQSSRRRIGQITALVGVVAVGAGLGLGVYANHLYDQQFDGAMANCTDDDQGKRCNDAGLTKTHRAHTLGNVGTIVGIAGVAAVGVGAYLWITAPRTTVVESSPKRVARRDLAIAPAVSPGSVGVIAVGRF